MQCKFCRKEHAATSENFPLVLKANREVFEGKGRNRKSVGIRPVVVGYCCKSCLNDYKKHKFVTEHKIVADPEGKRTVRQMIKDKLDEMRGYKKEA